MKFPISNIDLIKELKSLDDFSFQWYGLRQLDYSKKCGCSKVREEGITTSTGCSRCFRTGFLFSDFLVRGHIYTSVFGVEFTGPHGTLSTQTKYLILEWNRPIQKYSFILELDQELKTGKLAQPFKITRAFTIQDYEGLKGDNSRIEYWKCLIEERNFDDGRAGEDGTNNLYKGNRSNIL